MCELACSMKHHGVLNPDLARVRIVTLKSVETHVPRICMACDDAPCIKVCPMNARQRETNGTIVTDEDRCIGCRACIYICPTGTPAVNPHTHKTMTCDMCKGEDSAPWCVVACRFEGALRLVDADTVGVRKARKHAERVKSFCRTTRR
jgi:carbon-monoxide dehydrogenase iron sulfur subunit